MPRPSRLPRAGLPALRGAGWVALSSAGVIGRGLTAGDARDSARLNRGKELTQVTFVPEAPAPDLVLPSILDRVRSALPDPARVWLVGGAIRDALLRRAVHDLDFAVAGDGLALARSVSSRLGAAFYPLDEARGTGRVLAHEGAARYSLDFSTLRGGDLNADLADRDFTVDAIAMSLDGQLIDPMGGRADLAARRLRQCSPKAFEADPVRTLRVVRLAAQLDFLIDRPTRESARRAAPLLETVSAERVRDEFMSILGGDKPAAALKALEALELLARVVPETTALKGVAQSPPHISNVWEHTLAVVDYLEDVLGVLGRVHSVDAASEYALGYAAARVGRYRIELADHLDEELSAGRSTRSLLFLAALLHDIAKPETRSIEPDGRIRFIGHDSQGRVVAAARAVALRLAGAEVARVSEIVQHHMRPGLLAQLGPESVTPRAVYRYWRDAGPTGVGVCLLALADLLGTRGIELGQGEWAARVDTVVILLDAYYRAADRLVRPPTLVTGDDILALGVGPGRQVGELLELVREAQADGEVTTRGEALALVRRLAGQEPPARPAGL